MGRPKGSRNKIQTGIIYPRKCEHCDYVSNNPSMYHYHKQIHEFIPEDQMCEQGCGNFAKFKNTNGKYSCDKIVQRCPAYIHKHSTRVAEHWQRPEAEQRKQETKDRFFEHCCGVPSVIKKMVKTKREKFGTFDPDKAREYRHYARFIRKRAQKWAKEQGYILGKQTYHVDHKLSILDSWRAGLTEEVVNHPANLQIIEAKHNSSKGSKSILTVEELLNLICEGINP